jgi:hypothetical protein
MPDSIRSMEGPLEGAQDSVAVPPSLAEMFAELNGLSPQREAAFFYGLFLRGHSVESLRRDIDVDQAMLAKWRKFGEREPLYREAIEIIVPYRKRVLAIFESLITSERRQPQRYQ